MSPGTVYLVGAGPGDPGLLTVRGRDLLKRADVVVYDRLVAPALLEACRADAERVLMGKEPGPGGHASSQEAIVRLLVARAREGKRVVRLKGGDPFVLGRGGEEALALAAAGIPFEVVPGVTAAVAVPACAGIPVTHRGVARSFLVVSGHEDPPGGWAALACGADTLVVLMGLCRLPEIAAQLMAGGRSPDTPAAVISRGTTPEQRAVTGTLADIVDRVGAAGLARPAVAVFGEVVRLRDRIARFEEQLSPTSCAPSRPWPSSATSRSSACFGTT